MLFSPHFLMRQNLSLRLLWAGLLFVSSAALHAQHQQIRMTRIGGLVNVKELEGQEIKFQAKNGDLATEKDVVLTVGSGSRVILVFSNGATINVMEDSEVEIRQFYQDPFADDFSFAEAETEPSAVSRTEIFLSRGELVGQVKSLNDNSTFNVSTPAGTAGIRGTTFRVVFRPQGNGTAFFTVTTIEGDVGVTTSDGTVSTPIAVTDQEEIEIIVVVDDQTGAVTVSTPTTEISTKEVSTAVVAQVTEAVQEAAEAVVEIVLEGSGQQQQPDEPQQENQDEEEEDDQQPQGSENEDDPQQQQSGEEQEAQQQQQQQQGQEEQQQQQQQQQQQNDSNTAGAQNQVDNPSPTAGSGG
ncbi:MAG: hypothetical protein SynsKO_02160 [Synoicihabitans sp.]